MSGGAISKQVLRKSFSKLKDIVPVPNLIEVQLKSFNEFVQLDYLPSERKMIGLERVLKDVFPVDYEDKMSLEYVSYELGNWACTCGKLQGIENRYSWTCSSCKKGDCSRLSNDRKCTFCEKKTAFYKNCSNCLARVTLQLEMDFDECRASGQTFALPLKIKTQLIAWDISDSGEKSIRDIKEQNIFFADMPAMGDIFERDGRIELGDKGTFLINGVDRVVVSQLHRSPGAVFSKSKKVKDLQGKSFYVARIIPMRGSWLDFEFDSSECLYVRIDKKKKLLATTFFQALGISRDQIIPSFYSSDEILLEKGTFVQKVSDSLIGQKLEKDVLPKELSAKIESRKITKEIVDLLLKSKIDKLPLVKTQLLNRVFAKDVVDQETGEIIVEQGQVLTEELYDVLLSIKGLKFNLISSSGHVFQPTIALTLTHDHCYTQEEALKEVHAKLWPGDSSSVKDVLKRLESLFFSPRQYDLTKVGRVRMNRKLHLNISEDITVLTLEDIVATVKYLIDLREKGEGELDDIDHLGNRRVRLVGELLGNQVYLGFARIERIVRERFRMHDAGTVLMPQDLLNVKPLSAVFREFFGTGQLSQYVDQTNPLSELAHKRRLSALGPGGVMKDRATNEVRDVHPSHYGRICPIETPEGQTIGLISSLATYAMVNDLGFIETAYRPVKNGKIKDEVVFLDAFQESNKFIAQAESVDNSGKDIKKGDVLARYGGNFLYSNSENVDYVDLSPKQLVSVAAALIPFLEHDDASRALMGANMQRQSVPLMKCEAPLVGTGMEAEVCKAAGSVVIAKRSGTVEHVTSDLIIVKSDEKEFVNTDEWISKGVDFYHLRKFELSSFSTWIHQTPIVKKGERVESGQVLTNGSSIKDGELALGSNLLVAFMPWHGYNFEDAIVLSSRLVADDALTSVYIDEYIAEARDTKLGPEEITKDIPNVSEKALAGLDEDGIVKIGTRVVPGDILVGKVTLKGDIQFSPEEKLLRAIFGEKSREVRDTSLRVPPGVEGTVIDVKIFSRSGIRKDKRYKDIADQESIKIENELTHHLSLVSSMTSSKLIDLMVDQEVKSGSAKLLKNKKLDKSLLEKASLVDLFDVKLKDAEQAKEAEHIKLAYDTQVRVLTNLKDEKISRLKKGDPLPSGVIKMVKVYIANKRAISVGDKLAGRHGNKGVVSIIVPREDMPFREDGTPVDIVLNPVGVPSRMNYGQILETVLGFAGKTWGNRIGKFIEEASDKKVKEELQKCFGSDFVKEYESACGKEGLYDLARKIAKEGVHFKTPVFDGASFDGDILPILNDLNLSENGSYRLRDGRTGEYFDQPVTSGAIYMMKLNHMVDDKLHARSVGPYSLVTQQPLGGKAQFGGQRFGEMEVWALEAYGAAYTLQELLTYKSDDVAGRHRVYEVIVRGDWDNIPDPGLPESFNVLIKELQSLALKVDLFKASKEDTGE